MSKTFAGFLLVGGLAVAIVSGVAANADHPASQDWAYNVFGYGGLAAGIVAFFVGSLMFSRGK